MSHTHWVARQNKLEVPRCHIRRPRQGAADHCLTSRRRRCAEEVAIATVLLRELLETKTKVGSTAAKAPALRTNPKIDEAPTASKQPTYLSHPNTPGP
jgi:hypothetical protein